MNVLIFPMYFSVAAGISQTIIDITFLMDRMWSLDVLKISNFSASLVR